MKNFTIALAVIAALTLGALGTAQARDAGQRHGAHKRSHAIMQHRADTRRFKHAVDRRHVRQHARGVERRAHGHPGKRIWRMKHKRHWVKRHYRKHRRFHGRVHPPHPAYRPVYRAYPVAYPVYEDSPSRSLGFDIETEGFRFSVNKSG